MFLVGKLVWAVLQPGNLLMLCLLAGIVLLVLSRGRQRGRVLIGLSAYPLGVLFSSNPSGAPRRACCRQCTMVFALTCFISKRCGWRT